jgi:hypothetical protein
LRPESVFKVEPFGERWAVVSAGEALVVTATQADAVRLAQGAVMTLLPARPPPPIRPAAEPKSFAQDPTNGGSGFPIGQGS